MANELDVLESKMQAAIESEDIDAISTMVSERARVLAEFAATASVPQLQAANRQGREVANILMAERQRIFSGIRECQRLQRALASNSNQLSPLLRGVTG